MAGRYSRSSARSPDTICVATGSPNGSKADSITLPLRQVGTVVFAVPQLEQPLFRHRPIPADRGTVNPHSFGLEVVDPDELLVQRRLKLLPLLLIAQRIQHQGQAVIAKAPLTYLLPGADGQRLDPMGCLS